MKTLVRLFTLLFVIATFIACRANYRQLSINDMKLVLWDMIQMDSFNESFLKQAYKDSSDTAAARFYAEVFAMHKIKPEDFYKNFEIYKNSPVKMKLLLDSLDAYSERKRMQQYQERSENPNLNAPLKYE